jgi:hypothetical protein
MTALAKHPVLCMRMLLYGKEYDNIRMEKFPKGAVKYGHFLSSSASLRVKPHSTGTSCDCCV